MTQKTIGETVMTGIRILGFDLAMNHSGCVLLVNGKIENFWYFTMNKTSFKKGIDGEHSTLFYPSKDLKKDKGQMMFFED